MNKLNKIFLVSNLFMMFTWCFVTAVYKSPLDRCLYEVHNAIGEEYQTASQDQKDEFDDMVASLCIHHKYNFKYVLAILKSVRYNH